MVRVLTGHQMITGCTHMQASLIISVHAAQRLEHLTSHHKVTGCTLHNYITFTHVGVAQWL